MDVESVPDGYKGMKQKAGELVVFTNVEYRIASGVLERVNGWRSKRGPSGAAPAKGRLILSGVSGALHPARLTFILGPSGAGKSTLLQILAGRRSAGVSGMVRGAGRRAVLVPQNAELLKTLTARETLLFAASLKLPGLRTCEREIRVERVAKQLGIEGALDTRTGRLSGGECKRVCIASELLTDPSVLLLDEPTSGLDSVSSVSVIRALRAVASAGRTVACVLHQPASRLYAAADDVLLLAAGRTLYSGACADVPAALLRAGLVCPQYYNIADYLLEVATGEHNGNLLALEQETRGCTLLLARSTENQMYSNGVASTPEAEALLQGREYLKGRGSVPYAASPIRQLRALLWRCSVGAVRDVHLTQIRLVCHALVALLLGALYLDAGKDAGRVTSNTACLFFFLLFLFFSNAMPTIHTFPVEAKVVLQEHLNNWYSLPAYCFAKILADLPIQILCATVFCIPAWLLTGQAADAGRMALAWAVCALVTVLAQTFGLVVGALCGVKLGLFIVPAANIPMLMFSEFFIPYQEMPSYLQPLATVSYFRYAFDALMQTVYGFGRGKMPCFKEFCMFRNPEKYLSELGLLNNFNRDIYALCIWVAILQCLLMGVLVFKVKSACR